MQRDRQAVVWTRQSGKPVKMGRLYLTAADCRFTYELDYLSLQQPGLGVLYAPDIVQESTIIRPRTEFFDFLPPVQSLVPPKGDHNFQRKLVLSYLSKKGHNPSPGLDADWEILKIAGHGAIGHLDVFENDEKALQWYSSPPSTELFEISDDLGFSLKEMLSWLDQDASELINIIGPTPSVGGAIPKILLTIPETGWDNRIGLPSRGLSPKVIDVVAKFEQNTAYPGINELEALALDMHKIAGFDVPRYWLSDIRGIPVFAIERFDRSENQTPVFTETLYSVLATGDAAITNHHSYSYDAIGTAIDKSPMDIISQRKEGKIHLFKRLMMSLLTGNGDLHLENLSVTITQQSAAFTPVYDPTPMRAYAIHNMLSVMPFGDYGELLDDGDRPVGLKEAIQKLCRNLSISPALQEQIVNDCLLATEDFTDRVGELKTLPDLNKSNLIKIVSLLRKQISA
ncbi:MAG TPA: type II toxin-antitoxin system HipA family toxin [Gammaproteobacteria bacterium]|nr:type II toxin-antitoxin system HipA family toxin [Gammaproteobacteria bacterium]